MPITKLKFANVGPFDEIEFEFDEQVNVFVGPNNCGKSTVLMVLGEIVASPFVVPAKLYRTHSPEYTISIVLQGKEESLSWKFSNIPHPLSGLVSSEYYSCFIPALRWSTDYRPRGPATTKGREYVALTGAGEVVFIDPVPTEGRKQITEYENFVEPSTLLMRDVEVVQSIIDLDYKAYRENNSAIRAPLYLIAKVASEITEEFVSEFLKVGEDQRGLFPEFQTKDGNLPLNVLSQGTQSIIQWLSHLIIGYAKYYNFPDNLADKPGILIIDEINAHLHPSWQRRIIPALTKNFSRLQIFCSTHSPLMLAGLKAGQVQLLKRDARGKVTVSRNETDIIGWSADEILRSFLDVRNPTDLETTQHIERLQELRRKTKLTPKETKELERLRHTVSQDLLSGPIAMELEQLRNIIKTSQQSTNLQSKKKQSKEQRRSRRAQTHVRGS